MRRSIIANLTAACGVAALFCGCSANQTRVEWHESGPPQHHNSFETWWSYQYVYHPYAEVYYEPYTETYFWQQDGEWHEGHTLPAHITLEHDTAQVVKTQTERPWLQHNWVQATTMPPRDHNPARKNPAAPRSTGF